MKLKYLPNPSLFILGFLLAILITILDLASKEWIFAFLETKPNYQVKITSFFNLVMVYNRGVSFGLFNDLDNPVLILSATAIIISIILLIWLSKVEKLYLAIALGLIIGGAYGNIIDRIINGAVADFLDIHIANYHWPAFNLADSAITIGAILLIIDEFIVTKKKKKNDL